MVTSKLRVGVLVDKRDLLAWECEMLSRIANSDYAEVVLVACRNRTPAQHGRDRRLRPPSRLLSAARRAARAYQAALEDKVGGCVPDALAASSEPETLQAIPHLNLTPTQPDTGADVEPGDLETIKSFGLDVLIGWGTQPLKGDLLGAARFGAWSLLHADDTVGGPGFWEVFRNFPTTGLTLQIDRAGPENRTVIVRACWATCTASVRRNRNDFYWKASFQIPCRLEQLHLLGPDEFFANAERAARCSSIPPDPPPAMPSASDEIVLATRIFWRIYSNRIRNFFVSSQWILLFGFGDGLSLPPIGLRRIVPPTDRFWADPHVLIKDQRYYVFVEELRYAQRKGCISVMEIAEDGTHTAPRRVLEEPHHLSNPFVLAHDGQYFLIPESAQNRSVDLYRCVSFPDRWQRCETLLEDIHAVDTTILPHRGKWWLFTNVRQHVSGTSDDDLYLFYSDALQGGQWRSHPCNPIVSDVTRARPAGNIFEHEGRLYRPAQDCSVRYGYGVRIQEILEMSESRYVEREVAFIRPKRSDGIVATHTFSKVGRLVLSDALAERWDLFQGLRRAHETAVARRDRKCASQARR